MTDGYLRKCDEFLRASENSFKNDNFNVCVFLAYYSMLEVTDALLVSKIKGFRPKSHDGTIQIFKREFINRFKMENGYFEILNEARLKRHAASYDPETSFSKNEALVLLNNAKKFVKKLKPLV